MEECAAIEKKARRERTRSEMEDLLTTRQCEASEWRMMVSNRLGVVEQDLSLDGQAIKHLDRC